MGWSLMTKRQDISFWGPLMMYSAINAGQAIGSTAVITYLLDVHAKHTPEAISIVNLCVLSSSGEPGSLRVGLHH